MTTINWMKSELQPRISCNKPTIDGHEATNLISANATLSKKGLMVEPYVKPPVDIYISLPCNIELEKIVIGTTMGVQATSGIQLFAHSTQRDVTSSWLLPNNASCDIDVNNAVFNPIGRAFGAEQIFCFVNKRFSNRKPFTDFSSKASQCENATNIQYIDFYQKHRYVINNASHLNIRILKSKNVCVLKYVEVWGQPSASWSRNENLTKVIQHACLKQAQVCSLPSFASVSSNEKADATLTDSQLTNDINETNRIPKDIPSEFLDPLTCHIMALPIVLPSGQSVDQSTFDKHVQNEARWGRPPCDPFTGQLINEQNKPFVNTALKLRIDDFLLKADPSIVGPDVGRTVGSNKLQRCKSVSDHPLYSRKRTHDTNVVDLTAEEDIEEIDLTGDVESPVKCIKIDDSPIKPFVSSENSAQSSDLITSHSARLQSSLDFALSTALAVNSSHRTVDFPSPVNTNCGKCNAMMNEGYYELECTHVLCRKCLVGQKSKDNVQCAECSKSCSSKNVIKRHK